jgi:hypothetical protein
MLADNCFTLLKRDAVNNLREAINLVVSQASQQRYTVKSSTRLLVFRPCCACYERAERAALQPP